MFPIHDSKFFAEKKFSGQNQVIIINPIAKWPKEKIMCTRQSLPNKQNAMMVSCRILLWFIPDKIYLIWRRNIFVKALVKCYFKFVNKIHGNMILCRFNMQDTCCKQIWRSFLELYKANINIDARPASFLHPVHDLSYFLYLTYYMVYENMNIEYRHKNIICVDISISIKYLLTTGRNVLFRPGATLNL